MWLTLPLVWPLVAGVWWMLSFDLKVNNQAYKCVCRLSLVSQVELWPWIIILLWMTYKKKKNSIVLLLDKSSQRIVKLRAFSKQTVRRLLQTVHSMLCVDMCFNLLCPSEWFPARCHEDNGELHYWLISRTGHNTQQHTTSQNCQTAQEQTNE